MANIYKVIYLFNCSIFNCEFSAITISIEKKPFSDFNSLSKIIPSRDMASVDEKTLLEEDKFESQFKDIPPRFGFPMTVNFGYTNSGTT